MLRDRDLSRILDKRVTDLMTQGLHDKAYAMADMRDRASELEDLENTYKAKIERLEDRVEDLEDQLADKVTELCHALAKGGISHD